MQQLDITKHCELFKVKGVKIMNDIDGKKSIFYLPADFICYSDDQNGAVSFEKFTAEFKVFGEKVCFSVCVDDFLWIGKNFKLTDDEEQKAFFGDTTAKDSNGRSRKYSSIHARAAAVYSALCEGKIRMGELNKVED